VPKVVDHETRRRELTDALLRVVVRDGYDAISIRSVAEEAGCSVRPVQYYFADKAQLLAAAHARVTERMGALVTRAVRELGDAPRPRAVVETVVHAFLPTNDEARDAVIAYHCFFAAELTQPAIRIPGAGASPNALARLVRTQFERHWDREPTASEVRDIQLLVLTISTIAASVIAGYQGIEDATSLLDHQIDRLLPQTNRR
jgi:TetR/AcrR family transcriptional regulator, transcriptional repressor of bet genes